MNSSYFVKNGIFFIRTGFLKENFEKLLTETARRGIIYKHLRKRLYIAEWSSSVARRAHNPKVMWFKSHLRNQ